MKRIDLSKVGAVCADCAKAHGFTPKNKAVGHMAGAQAQKQAPYRDS